MAKHSKKSKKDNFWSPVFNDVARALGFSKLVDRKRDNDKKIKEGGG